MSTLCDAAEVGIASSSQLVDMMLQRQSRLYMTPRSRMSLVDTTIALPGVVDIFGVHLEVEHQPKSVLRWLSTSRFAANQFVIPSYM